VMDTSKDPKLQEAQSRIQYHPHQNRMMANGPIVNKGLLR
jgi:hypothetical protein